MDNITLARGLVQHSHPHPDSPAMSKHTKYGPRKGQRKRRMKRPGLHIPVQRASRPPRAQCIQLRRELDRRTWSRHHPWVSDPAFALPRAQARHAAAAAAAPPATSLPGLPRELRQRILADALRAVRADCDRQLAQHPGSESKKAAAAAVRRMAAALACVGPEIRVEMTYVRRRCVGRGWMPSGRSTDSPSILGARRVLPELIPAGTKGAPVPRPRPRPSLRPPPSPPPQPAQARKQLSASELRFRLMREKRFKDEEEIAQVKKWLDHNRRKHRKNLQKYQDEEEADLQKKRNSKAKRREPEKRKIREEQSLDKGMLTLKKRMQWLERRENWCYQEKNRLRKETRVKKQKQKSEEKKRLKEEKTPTQDARAAVLVLPPAPPLQFPLVPAHRRDIPNRAPEPHSRMLDAPRRGRVHCARTAGACDRLRGVDRRDGSEMRFLVRWMGDSAR